MRFSPLHILLLGVIAMLLGACSVKRNTATSRFWQGFTAHYNTYYNGTVAYIEGSLEKEKGNVDNYTEMIPLYTVGNKASRDLGKAKFDIAILKSQKAIQLHSIKAKPQWTKNRKKTEADIEWLNRKEYNPFIWRAWMLMGRSQFYQGRFDEAAATFSYMSRLYRTQPAIYGKARAWLAKCFIEEGWIYDAEDVIRNMQRDSIHWKARKEWDYTYCDYYLHTGDLPKAAEYLRKVIKHEMRSKQRAREYYLLGQIEAAMKHKKEAYEAFRKCTKQNPPYQLEFNARISMTEVVAEGQTKKMINRLKRMARNPNNKDFVEQVYYAIGNIYLAEKDTMNAIDAYEQGNKKATRAGIEKGVLLLHLGDLYWAKEKYSDARRCYGEAIGLLDKDREDYEQLSERSKILDELVPYTDAVYLQDSLQALVRMPEAERNEAIDRVIEMVKKQEKEEADRLAAEEADKMREKNDALLAQKAPDTPVTPGGSGALTKDGKTVWYFYNPTAVQQGKRQFERQWGRRENTDNWRRSNVTVVGTTDVQAEEELTDAQRDSIALEEKKAEEMKAHLDSAVNNPHKREYYLAQLPFTDEQMAASNEILADGLYNSGVIFKDKLDNLPLSEKALLRLVSDFPDFKSLDEAYYHLYLLYSRKGDKAMADVYLQKLKEGHPESKLTILLSDPNFESNARYGVHIEDSLYGAAYEAFKADRFHEVYENDAMTEKRFPLGANRDRFIFITGLTHLNSGDTQGCVERMERIVNEYPESRVAEMAGMIVNGVKQGRRLHGAKFDLGNVWNRRNVVLNDSDKLANRTFNPDQDADFHFVMVYAPDSLDENKLLFQMARYNFTNFLVRNFDISIEEVYGMHHMMVSGFRNFHEARMYARMLLQQEGIKALMGNKARPMVISTENLNLIGAQYSYNDYDAFYKKHFAPLTPMRSTQLYEPAEVPVEKHYDSEGEIDNDPVKPMLPMEDVAPGGAKPVDPNAELENEIDEGITIPETLIDVPETEVTTPATEVTVPATEITVPEAEVKAPATEINVPDAAPAPAPAPKVEDNTIVVPEAEVKAPVTEINVPDAAPAPAPAPKVEDNTIVVPEAAPAPAPKVEDNTIVVPEAAPAPAPKVEDNTIVVPEAAPAPTPKVENNTILIPVEETKPKTEETIIFTDEKAEKAKKKESDDIIIITDEKEEKKKSSKDLEDEYYELDGF